MSNTLTLLKNTAKAIIAVSLSAVVLTGCKTTTTQRGPIAVGPGPGPTMNEPVKRVYSYNSDIYLDVAVPVFNPGFPLDSDTGQIDYDQVEELGIWPQLRRAEAKRFAIQSKRYIEDTQAFGQVFNVPNAKTSADIFVMGTILESNSRTIELNILVIDSSGEILGDTEIEHEVSKGFFRDKKNEGKNPYEPVFQEVADYVYDVVRKIPDQRKDVIKTTTAVRYAKYYAPEAFGNYIETNLKTRYGRKYFKHELTAVPAENDPVMEEIAVLRAKEMNFVDAMQEHFDAFEATTEEPYRDWQEETLPEVIRAEDAAVERNTKATLGVLAGIAAVILDKNSDSNAGKVGAVAGAIGSAWMLKDAFEANADMKESAEIINEQGSGLDFVLSPTVMKAEDDEVKLTGTAEDQYEQWKAILKKMYDKDRRVQETGQTE